MLAAAIVLTVLLAILLYPLSRTSHVAFSTEMQAVRIIVTINAAQSQYKKQTGHYAANLNELKTFIQSDLPFSPKSGYNFQLIPTPAGYDLIAWPSGPGHERRTFFSDQTMAIRTSTNAPANRLSPMLGAR